MFHMDVEAKENENEKIYILGTRSHIRQTHERASVCV